MEVKEFQDLRNSDLENFKDKYAFLRSEYSSALLSAIQEQDPEKQQELISQILSINSEMTDELKTILSKMNQKVGQFDVKTLDELTADLIQYQKDYSEIEKSKDRVNTLKKIHSQKSETLASSQTMFYVYIGAFFLLCIVIGFLIIKTGWIGTVTEVVTGTTGGRRRYR